MTKTNSYLKWAGWFVLCAVLQSTLIPHAAVFSIKPDLIMLVLFHLVIKYGVMPGVYVGFFIGVAHDLFSPSLLGQNALSMSVMGYICGHFNERILRLDPILKALLLIAAFVINDTIIMLVHITKTEGTISTLFIELLVVTLPRALYTLIFAAIPFIWVNVVRPPRLVD
ncbi:MAG: rod shape-determining protein MreD [Chitinispirillales bacterium]|jgi:rod shape-determining protein MreD|nr:rod shape-determining protein MreD [Chitinispirillales bacterium]